MYARLLDESEEGLFEVPPGSTNVIVIIKPLPGATKLYVFQNRKSACLFYLYIYKSPPWSQRILIIVW